MCPVSVESTLLLFVIPSYIELPCSHLKLIKKKGPAGKNAGVFFLRYSYFK